MIGAHWQLEPLQVLPVLLFAGMYAARARALSRRGRPVPGRRMASFYTGLGLVTLALISPVDWYAENRRLWVHMIQHLVLGDIAPLLVVLGLTRAILRPVLAIRWIDRLRWLAHPLVALPMWIVSLAAWHLSPLYQLALRHDAAHALQHICFFTFGALMWAAVIEPVPGPAWFGNGWKAIYTLVVRTAGMILANAFIWAGSPFYGYYVAREHGGALADQRAAGAIMFIEGGVVTLLAFAWLFLRFTRETELLQRLLEHDVDGVRAARAARYDRSAQARRVMR